MSEQYTPTTEEIADWWAHKGGSKYSPYYASKLTMRVKEFDRWLAKHDAEVAAKAWDEGANALSIEMVPDSPTARMEGMKVRTMRPANPYRKAVESE